MEFVQSFPGVFIVLLFTFIAAANGKKLTHVFFISVVACYLAVIQAFGGFHDQESLQMGMGWGIIIMMPLSGACLLLTCLGGVVRDGKKSKSTDMKNDHEN